MLYKKKRLVLWLVIAVISLCTALYFYRPLRSFVPFHKKFLEIARNCYYRIPPVFRNPLCSFSEVEKGPLSRQCIEENFKHLMDRSRLVSEDSEGYQLWETPKGQFWVPAKNGFGNIISNLAEQECKMYGSGKVGVRSDDIVLDCGANVGAYTREALNAGAKLIVAIEPSPGNIKCLHQNFKTEIEQGRVIIYEKGVWNREEILTFYTSEDSETDTFVFSRKRKDSHVTTMPVTTIDKLVDELKLDRVDFIKMDIEGSEENALIGAKKTIAKYRPRMALALEHATDYKKEIGRMLNIIRSSYPKYQTQCGYCGITREGRQDCNILYIY